MSEGTPEGAGGERSGLSVHPRAQPRRLGQWPLVLVLTGVTLGLALVGLGRFRWGVGLVGAAVLLGGVLRAVLPARTSGLLVVRSRLLDTGVLGVLGCGLTTLALVVPTPQ